MGHARALLSVDNPARQLQLYEQIQEYGYSVRKVEELAKEMSVETPASHEKRSRTKQPASTIFYATIFPNFSKHRYNLPAMPKGKGRSLFRLKTKKNWNDLSPSSIN